MATTTARRRQQPITIRSTKAAERLALLTRDGRSQAQVIEEALDRMPLPTLQRDRETIIASINEILDSIPKGSFPTMAEIDDELYDEYGLPR
jgi:antitoxin VapB